MQIPSIDVDFSQSAVNEDVGNSSVRKNGWSKFAKNILVNVWDTALMRTTYEEDKWHKAVNNEDILFFLQHGGVQRDLLHGEASINERDVNMDQHFLDRLTVIVGQSDDALNRLLYGFSIGFKQRVVAAISTQFSPAVGKLIALLTRQKGSLSYPDQMIIMAYILYRSEEEIPDSSFASLVTILFWSMANETSKYALTATLIKFIQRDHSGTALFIRDEQWQHTIRSFVKQVMPAKAAKLQQTINRLNDKRALNNINEDLKTALTSPAYKEIERRDDVHKWNDNGMGLTADAIYINNAGLVIIYPFIQSLFEAIGLLKPGGLHDEIDRSAPVVLQYILQGNQDIEERDLPLNKVLCGLAPATFVPCSMELSARCAQACEELLLSVIDHWGVLKNISIDTFRHTFLQRKGKLEKAELGWKLYVEPKGVDVLLSSLPWDMDVSTIKLPWMDDCLVVEWANTTGHEVDTTARKGN